LPLYALDKHTQLGRSAIARFATENTPVRQFLEAHVQPDQRREAALMAALYADATPVTSRLDWPLSDEIEVLGRETDLPRAGVPPEAHERLCALVRQNLEHLNDIRAAILVRSLEAGRARHG
jgi:hypothetical protein